MAEISEAVCTRGPELLEGRMVSGDRPRCRAACNLSSPHPSTVSFHCPQEKPDVTQPVALEGANDKSWQQGLHDANFAHRQYANATEAWFLKAVKTQTEQESKKKLNQDWNHPAHPLLGNIWWSCRRATIRIPELQRTYNCKISVQCLPGRATAM